MKRFSAVLAVAILGTVAASHAAVKGVHPSTKIYNYCYSNYQYCLSECGGNTDCRLNCIDAYNACRYY
jgi:hypothetical protein